MAAFYYGLLFLGRKCLHATSQKRALSHAISLAVNYRLFSHGDVSYSFNGKNDNVELELSIILGTPDGSLNAATCKDQKFNHKVLEVKVIIDCC